jgi:glutamine amidotransferase
MIGIIDYGMGNLYSVSKSLERLQVPFVLSGEPSELEKTDGLLLPGVGSFKDAMAILDQTGLKDYVEKEAASGKPLFGICLGMQLLFDESEENGLTRGFGFLPGKVERFSSFGPNGETYKVPHMGWNNLRFHDPDHLLLKGTIEEYVYFVHSYVVKAGDADTVVASSDYNGTVPAVVAKGNVFGAQFHPEKSAKLGMAILNNFCNYVEGEGC